MGFIFIWISLAWITHVSGAPTERDLRFKGVAKPYTLTPRTKGGWRVPVASFGRSKDYPEVLQYSLTIEGRESIDIRLVRDVQIGDPLRDIPTPRRTNNVDNQYQGQEGAGFYRDDHGHGSYACKLRKDENYEYMCDIYGLVTFEDETCYITPGSTEADCSMAKDGLIEYLSDDLDSEESPKQSPTGEGSRQSPSRPRSKRKLRRWKRKDNGPFGFPEGSFRTLELAFVLDEAFMQTFYDRRPWSRFFAQMEAEMLIILMCTEINVFFHSLSKASEGKLKLYCYPAAIVYPEHGENFHWSAAFSDGRYLNRTNAMISSLQAFVKHQFNDIRNIDHVVFITGLDYSNGGRASYLGFAYTKKICTRSTSNFSFMEFDPSQAAYIATHEIGHALGSDHDESTPCRGRRNVMSRYMASPSAFVVASTWEFSSCSADAILKHLDDRDLDTPCLPSDIGQQPKLGLTDCTSMNGFTDREFRNRFCTGLIGEASSSINIQCQKLTGSSKSYSCTAVDAAACSSAWAIQCYSPTHDCSVSAIFDTSVLLPWLWNGTPCGRNKMCFKGQCVDKFKICS